MEEQGVGEKRLNLLKKKKEAANRAAVMSSISN